MRPLVSSSMVTSGRLARCQICTPLHGWLAIKVVPSISQFSQSVTFNPFFLIFIGDMGCSLSLFSFPPSPRSQLLYFCFLNRRHFQLPVLQVSPGGWVCHMQAAELKHIQYENLNFDHYSDLKVDLDLSLQYLRLDLIVNVVFWLVKSCKSLEFIEIKASKHQFVCN